MRSESVAQAKRGKPPVVGSARRGKKRRRGINGGRQKDWAVGAGFERGVSWCRLESQDSRDRQRERERDWQQKKKKKSGIAQMGTTGNQIEVTGPGTGPGSSWKY